MNSSIYEGQVRHRRYSGPAHAFSYPLFLLYLDLAELPQVFDQRWLWSVGKPNLASFRREDHFGSSEKPLADCVRDLVAERTGERPTGPIRLLTNLRFYGYVINPVSFYYCWNEADDRIHSVVAEVTNTPWGERHLYVVRWQDNEAATQNFELTKELHVSPFFPMNQKYRWNLTTPSDHLTVEMNNIQDGEKVFDASLELERRPLTAKNMVRCLVKYPAMTARVAVGIYYQAARLRLKGATYHAAPQSLSTARTEVST